MAKTGVFLRGARGKFAGSVLYKGERGTIIRENVVPSNPQSIRQMCQRVAFATVASAARFMLPVIGETFLGAANEKVNRRAFIANNVNTLRDWFYKASKGVPNIPARATAKGYSVLVPNQYMISKGTLEIPECWRVYQRAFINGSFNVGFGGLQAVVPDGTYTAAELLKRVLRLEPGMQVTLCRVYKDSDESVLSIDGDDLGHFAFNAKRLVVKDDLSGLDSLTVESTMEPTDAVDLLADCFDADLSDDVFYNQLGELLGFDYVENEGLKIDNDFLDTLIGNIGWIADNTSYASFISKKNGSSWDYSTSYMGIQLSTSSDYGLHYPNALTTFIKSGASDSSKFTQAGGSDNSVG